MIPTKEFIGWLQNQSKRPLRHHIRHFLADTGLQPTKAEVQSLSNGMYNRLRKCGGRLFPMIEYHPQGDRAAADDTQISYAETRELAIVTDAIRLDGFTLPEMTTALTEIRSTHSTANVSQQKAVGALVKATTAELAIKDVKVSNAEELARRDRETTVDLRNQLDETRRDKAFYQSMISRKGGGGVI